MSLVRLRPKAPDAGVAHPVERHLAKVEVASSSLVTRSKIAPERFVRSGVLLCFGSGENVFFLVDKYEPMCEYVFMMKNARDGGIHMARKRQETLVLFKDVLSITEKFSDAQFGALMRAAFDYRFEGEGYQGEDALVELAFRMLEAQIDRYREACETNTKNAQREEPMRPAAQEVPETIPQEAPGESCANEGERNAAESSEMQPNAPSYS